MKSTLMPYINKIKQELNCCIQTRTEQYTSGSTIMEYGLSQESEVGILLQGSAILYTLDLYGNRNILEALDRDSIFGELFAASDDNHTYYLEARSDCQVLFLSYEHLLHRCSRDCVHHEELLSALFHITSIKSQEAMNHLDIISQRTIRNKLLAYFSHLGLSSEMPVVTLPLTWTDVADYICVERSAMMRELKKMKDEGLICGSGREVSISC